MATRRDEWTVQLDQKGLDETLAATLMDGSVPQLGSRLMALATLPSNALAARCAVDFFTQFPIRFREQLGSAAAAIGVAWLHGSKARDFAGLAPPKAPNDDVPAWHRAVCEALVRALTARATPPKSSKHVPTPPIPKQGREAIHSAWMEKAKARSLDDLPELVDRFPEGPGTQLTLRALEFLTFPRDPRIADAAAAFIERPSVRLAPETTVFSVLALVLCVHGDASHRTAAKVLGSACHTLSWVELALPTTTAARPAKKRSPSTPSDERSFLRVIAEKPTDEAAVALFQDWLLERGEPRGEFLALQRATRPLTPKESKHLAALQKKHEKQWLGSFGPGALKGSARFRSGLPRAVRVSAWKPSDVPKTDDPVLPLLESFWLEGGTNLPLAGVFDGPWRSLAELTAPEFVLAETNQAVLDALVSLGIVRSAGDLEDAERFEVLRRLGSKKLRHLALREQWWSGATELALMKKELGRLESLTVETNDLEAWLALAGVVRELVIAPSEDAHDAASRPRLRVRGGSLTVTLPAVLDEPKHVEDAVALLKQLPAKLRKGAAIESATTPPKVISALIR